MRLGGHETGAPEPLSTPIVARLSAGTYLAVASKGTAGTNGHDSRVRMWHISGSTLETWDGGAPVGFCTSDAGSFYFGNDNFVQIPSFASLLGGTYPEILIGRNEQSASMSNQSEGCRKQRLIVFDPDDDTDTRTCELILPLPSRPVDDRHVASQVVTIGWGETGDYRMFAGSHAGGVVSWLWDDDIGDGCEGIPDHGEITLMTGERVAGTPWVGNLDNDGYFDLVAVDVGGKVWAWDLHEPYDANKIEWGQYGHDERNSFTYTAGGGSSRQEDGPSLGLASAAPNPFNPETRLGFSLGTAAHTRLRVYDAGGRLVRTLVDGRREAGDHAVAWPGLDDADRPVGSGVYFVVLEAEGRRLSRKAILSR